MGKIVQISCTQLYREEGSSLPPNLRFSATLLSGPFLPATPSLIIPLR